MATDIHVAFSWGATRTANPWLYNEFLVADTVTELSSDLLDSTGASTGYTLDITTAFTNEHSGSQGATGGVGDWTEAVFDWDWFINNGSTAVLQFGGLNENDTFVLEVAGHYSSASRDTDFTVSPANESTTTYDNAGTGAPTDHVTFTGTIGAAGTIDVTTEGITSAGQINGIKLIITAGAGGAAPNTLTLLGVG